MTAETTPELLAEGDMIVGARDGKAYEVVEINNDADDGDPPALHVVLRREGGSKLVGVDLAKLPARITLLSTRREREAHALALVQVRLGAEVMATREEGQPYVTAASFSDPSSLYSHLYIFHFVKDKPKDGTTYPEGALTELVKAHTAMHESGRIAETHEHSPTFYRDLKEQGAKA